MHGVSPYTWLLSRPSTTTTALGAAAERPGLPASTPTPAGPVTTGADAPDDAPTSEARPFRLTAGGRELSDCRTLASYGIEPGMTLDCVLALCGGAPTADGPGAPADDPVDAAPQAPVSYTHLTLPTKA